MISYDNGTLTQFQALYFNIFLPNAIQSHQNAGISFLMATVYFLDL